jgi:hypothetical protein
VQHDHELVLNAGIHLQNNAGSATVSTSVFGNSVTAPGTAFPLAALFADNGGTATDTHHDGSRRWFCRQ